MDIRSFFSGKASTGASETQPEAKGAGRSGSKRKAPCADTSTTKVKSTAQVAAKIKHSLPSVVYYIRAGIIEVASTLT